MNATVMRLLALFLFAILAAIAPFYLPEGAQLTASEFFLLLTLAMMWNMLAGYGGLMSLGHQAFFGLGGFVVYFVSNSLGAVPYWVIPVAPVATALIAAVLALFLFRLRDAYFAIASWVAAEIIALLVVKNPWLGGVSGLALDGIALIDFDWFQPIIFWISATIAAGSLTGIFLLLRSRLGLALMTIRDNELAATSVGVDVWRTRFIAYVLSAAGCGLAGSVSLMTNLQVSPVTAFSPNWIVAMMFIVVVGGIGTLEGPILGTIIYFALREILTNVWQISGTWYLVAMGSVAVLTMMFAPQGLWPMVRDRLGWDWLNVGRSLPRRLRPGA